MEVLEKKAVTTENGLFDTYGRLIPRNFTHGTFAKSRRYFSITQPEIDYEKIYTRLAKHLNVGDSVSKEEFEARAEKILTKLRGDANVSQILNGVRVPFMLPVEASADIGTLLENKYLPAVQSAFTETFPEKNFSNHHKGGLAGKLAIALGSRHEKLLKAQQTQVLVGYYFPCVTEYSVPAAIESIAQLPDQFLLAGGVDTAAAMIAAPDLLLRKDGYPPVLWLSALDTEKNGAGYHFEAYGYHLTFNRRVHLDQPAESWASGLVVLG